MRNISTGLNDSWASAMPNLKTELGFVDILCADIEGKQEEYVIKINDLVVNDSVTNLYTVYRSNLYTGLGSFIPGHIHSQQSIRMRMVAFNPRSSITRISMEMVRWKFWPYLFTSLSVIRVNRPNAIYSTFRITKYYIRGMFYRLMWSSSEYSNSL